MPNTEVKLVNAESTWLEAIWEDRKLLNKISISYEVLFLLCISSQIASGLACYVRKYKLNFRNREMLEKRKTHPFEKIGVSLVCMRWTLVNSVTGCKRLRLASDLPAVKQQAGWNRLRFTKWGRKYLLGSPGRIQLPEDSSSGSCMFQTVKQEIRRISIRKLRLAAKLLNKLDTWNGVFFYLPLSPRVEL